MHEASLRGAQLLRLCCIIGLGHGLFGCAGPGSISSEAAAPATILETDSRLVGQPNFVVEPRFDNFSVCHGHGCKNLTQVHLDRVDWHRVSRLFKPSPQSPQQERERIRTAIALFEQIVGRLNGTSGDRGGTFAALGQDGQNDCVDESTNTTVYLALLQTHGLLVWHDVAHRSSRGIPNNLLLRWPHSTAVIRERDSRSLYAVDSWFLDNGEPPFIVPLKVWKAGWSPPS